MKLSALVDELEGYIPSQEKENAAVSSTTIGWQIVHAFKVMKAVLQTLEASTPNENYQPKFNASKLVIMTTGRIPRGVGRAPKMTLPKENELTVEYLENELQAVRALVERAKKLPKDAHFPHPFFGSLKKKAAFRFLGIHTNHHVKIIRDMLQKK
jgi:hypothetical protein